MPIPFRELVLASNNPGKIREFSALFVPLGIRLIPQGDLHLPEADEPFATFVENALAKARHAARLSGKAALADDSGIGAAALDGAPGVFSARFAGEEKSDAANNQKLDALLRNETDKRVFYYCALVLLRHAADPFPLIACGSWAGQWTHTPRGQNGFGYDPHFFLPEYGQTAAELSGSLKNGISHRAQASAALAAQLEKTL